MRMETECVSTAIPIPCVKKDNLYNSSVCVAKRKLKGKYIQLLCRSFFVVEIIGGGGGGVGGIRQ